MGVDWTEEEQKEQTLRKNYKKCWLCNRDSPMQIPGMIRLRPGLFLQIVDDNNDCVWLCEDCQCDLQDMALKLAEYANPKPEPEEPKLPEVKLK